MKSIEVKLDNVPALGKIAKSWKKLMSTAPIELRRNPYVDFHGGIIFSYAIIKGKDMVIDAGTYDSLFEDETVDEDLAIDNFTVRFKISSKNQSDCEVEILIVLSKDNMRIDNILCIGHVDGNHRLIQTISEVINFIDENLK